MRQEQSVQNKVDHSGSQQTKSNPKQVAPSGGGSQVQFKILIAVIGFGVLMLILKAVGLV